MLAGPILRRVEPTLVSVWVALSKPATIRISLWEGRATGGSANPFIASDPPGTPTLRVGAKLHVAVATIKIPPTSPRLLQPERIYSYDVAVVTAAGTQTLKSLGLLNTGAPGGKRVEALGFEENFLPAFALPPADLTELRILFGSCRLPANSHLDAVVFIDDLMRDNAEYDHKEPLKRPHQMFLGGDQIYADDVSPVHLHHLIDLGKELIGTSGGASIEHLKVNQTRSKPPGSAQPTGFASYDHSNTPGALPADHAFFPAGRRFLLTTVDAQMTTVDARSHLYSLGEFAAMYLSVWSNAVWPALERPSPSEPAVMPLPDDGKLMNPVWPDRIPTLIDAPLNAEETRFDEASPADNESPFKNYVPFKEESEEDGGSVEKRLEGHRRLLRDFERGLAKVRRVLANIPTYMVFDDHDVTDDWNLNPLWYDRVMTTPLGVNIVRNALVAYALFQDWGNDPLKYEAALSDKRKLLDEIADLFPEGATQGPDAAAAGNIDALLGLGLRAPMDIDGSFPETRPPLKWHFSVGGPGYLAIALDNRTRRSFVSRHGPPGNVALTAQQDQIPQGPLPAGKEVLIVIAPLQVIGPPLLDELVAPASYRVFDMVSYTFKNRAREGLKGGSRGMAGTNPDAIEAWAFDVRTFEALLARLEPHRRVVLLSGDVHYSASNAMSYWTRGSVDPARFVQFTSSGFKNVMPAYITTVDRSLPLAQQLVRAKVGAERLGWNAKPPNPVLLPPGSSEADVPRALRAKLDRAPVMIPTYGWPAGSTINPATPPDWQWRVEPVIDLRPDGERPQAARPLEIDKDALNGILAVATSPRTIEAFQALAARHQRTLETLRNSRQILFRSNFGVLRFEREDGVLHAVHEVYTALPKTADETPRPELFVRHRAALATPGAPLPADGLQPLTEDAQV